MLGGFTLTFVTSFEVNGVRTYQIVWNELTVLGPAWNDPVVSHASGSSAFQGGPATAPAAKNKRRASEEPELQPPARRGPFLFKKAPSGSLLESLRSMDTDTKAKNMQSKGKGKAVSGPANLNAGTGADSDSELSDYEMN